MRNRRRSPDFSACPTVAETSANCLMVSLSCLSRTLRSVTTMIESKIGAPSLFQSPQYNNGTPLPALGGLPGLDRIGAGTPSGGGMVIQ